MVMSTFKWFLTISRSSTLKNRLFLTLAPLVCAAVLSFSLSAISAYGQHLYVANVGTQAARPTVEIFNASSSTLTWQGSNTDMLPGPPLALALGPKFLYCRENRFGISHCQVLGTLYVATSTGAVVRYSIDSTG